MIVCHCNAITDRDIHAAIDWMRAADSQTIITPGKIYHALGKKPDCGGCLSLFIDTMAKSDSLGVPAVLTNLRPKRGRFVSK
ncbi:(2Fe-2S)-binding protein [Pseudooceanicola sp. C21-150M6]|uniref:(2Fe-2S)-binding protein n=1 Tax=Pseudooceanicola sp. C21-150M6 TaxID=3434355 RepID=UPI003D7F519C